MLVLALKKALIAGRCQGGEVLGTFTENPLLVDIISPWEKSKPMRIGALFNSELCVDFASCESLFRALFCYAPIFFFTSTAISDILNH